jgi:competence protein ComFC
MGLFDLIFSDKCLTCSKEGKYICQNCLDKVGSPKPICPVCLRPSIDGMTHSKCKTPQSLDGLICSWNYDGVIKKAILALKYKFASEIAKELADLSVQKLSAIRYGRAASFAYQQSAILVPIPLFWYRQNWRGFNQAEEIGKLIAEKMKWKFIPELLIRTKHTVSQTELSKEKRGENVRGIFSLNPNYVPSTRYSVLLFDDVWTTGSTLKEAGKVLKRKGFQKVWGLTLAR